MSAAGETRAQAEARVREWAAHLRHIADLMELNAGAEPEAGLVDLLTMHEDLGKEARALRALEAKLS